MHVNIREAKSPVASRRPYHEERRPTCQCRWSTLGLVITPLGVRDAIYTLRVEYARRLPLAAIVVVLLMARFPVASAGSAAIKNRDLVALVMRGVADERAKIRSGVVLINGTRTIRRRDQPGFTGNVQSTYVFDMEKKFFRYDNIQEQRIRILNSENTGASLGDAMQEVPANIHTRYLSYIKNKQYAVFWTRDGNQVFDNITLVLPSAEPPHAPMKDHHYCDIRAAGLMAFEQFQTFTSPQNIVDKLLQTPVAEVQSNDKRVEIHFVNDAATSVVVVETTNGYRPISRRTRMRQMPVVNRTDASWIKKNGVDVPVRIVMVRESPEHEYLLKYDLSFNWRSLNEPIDPKYFDYHDLEHVPTGGNVFVIDSRREEAEVVGVWKGDGRVVLSAMQKRRDNIDDVPMTAASSPWMITMIIVNGVALAMIGVYWLFWRGRQAKTT